MQSFLKVATNFLLVVVIKLHCLHSQCWLKSWRHNSIIYFTPMRRSQPGLTESKRIACHVILENDGVSAIKTRLVDYRLKKNGMVICRCAR